MLKKLKKLSSKLITHGEKDAAIKIERMMSRIASFDSIKSYKDDLDRSHRGHEEHTSYEEHSDFLARDAETVDDLVIILKDAIIKRFEDLTDFEEGQDDRIKEELDGYLPEVAKKVIGIVFNKPVQDEEYIETSEDEDIVF